MGVKLPDAFHDAMANPPRTEFDEWSDRFREALRNVAEMAQEAIPVPGKPGSFVGPIEPCGDFFGVVTADGANYATLTIGGKSVPVSDVTWRFTEDEEPEQEGFRVNGADVPVDSPTIVLTTTCELTPEQVEQWDAFLAAMPKPAWPQWVRVTAWDEAADVPVFEHDTWESFRDRVLKADAELWERVCARFKPRWRSRGFCLRRESRWEKATAKRTKMRTARYAARWEQAHLRGGK